MTVDTCFMGCDSLDPLHFKQHTSGLDAEETRVPQEHLHVLRSQGTQHLILKRLKERSSVGTSSKLFVKAVNEFKII